VDPDFEGDGFFELSPLLAQRSTTDRCKSFISIHIAKQGGVGGYDKSEIWVLAEGGGNAKFFRLFRLREP